jgi:uncharacterized protein
MISTATAIPADVRAEIEKRLATIQAEEDVQILMAVESGSRAWGFPSPDSDYDIRFIYVHKRDWYLNLRTGRDVIEQPIVDDIDLNGWDIRKTLGLLLKSNAIVSEWMESPIRYQPDHSFVSKLAALADAMLDARALAHHYARLGRTAADRWLDNDGDVPVKKYFYALRPALAIRVLRLHSDKRPPMNLQKLLALADLPEDMVAQIEALVDAKARTNEKSNGMRIAKLDAFIRDELSKADEIAKRAPSDKWAEEANRLFVDLVNQI